MRFPHGTPANRRPSAHIVGFANSGFEQREFIKVKAALLVEAAPSLEVITGASGFPEQT